MAQKAHIAPDWILVGRIGAAHGVRGEVRLATFTAEPEAIAAYGPLLTDRPGLTVEIAAVRPAKTVLVARLKGIPDRNAAEKLNGVGLYIPRDRLPEPDEDEFYHADLIGLEVRQSDGSVLGTVTALANFGADDLLDIRRADTGKSVYLPFTRTVVLKIQIAEGYLLAIPPEGWLDDTPRDPEDRDPGDTAETGR